MRLPRYLQAAALAVSLAVLGSFEGPGVVAARAIPQTGQPATSFVDLAVIDEAGRPITSLKPEELRVSIDKEPRRIVSLRYVYRGPGAKTSAALADAGREAPAAAEQERLVLLVIDESSITPGQEKPVVAAASRVLDELAAGDQATVVTLPLSGKVIHLAADAATRAASLAGVRGRAAQPEGATASGRADEELRKLQEAAEQATAASKADPDDPTRVAERQQAAMQEQRLGHADNADPEARKARVSAMRALQPIVDGFRNIPGLKTVVVVQQADAADLGSPDQRKKELNALVESAVRSRTAIHLVAVGLSSKKNEGSEDLRQVAVGTGGTFTIVRLANSTKAYDALRAALWGGYVVEVESRKNDAEGRPHALRVDISRSKVSVRAAQLWVPRSDPIPTVLSAAAAPAVAPATPEPNKVPAPGPVPASDKHARKPRPDDPALTILLARMSEYLDSYLRDFANVVTEENSVMEVTRGWRGGERVRQLKSDLLLVKTSDRTGWLQYRDVFEVNGKPVRDREARVQKLFIEHPETAMYRAQEISDESSRYNLGDLRRTMNLPTLPLVLFSPASIKGVVFDRDGEETVNGIRAARIKFEEMERPTLVRQIETNQDAPSSGTVWIDPSTGRVLKTLLEVSAAQSTAIVTVTYKPGGNTGIWVPADMREVYRRPGYEISGRAEYSNFRSFKVTTDMTIEK